ncbi:hypothetical protein ACFPN1_03375 [Lysobacter yangpyeongensis]|uniref:HNH endonuclease n=1 Tax=Lysobacter yangpyeongensis TaxID=346182 RepID=A0ABW0SJ76_9GAMM
MPAAIGVWLFPGGVVLRKAVRPVAAGRECRGCVKDFRPDVRFCEAHQQRKNLNAESARLRGCSEMQIFCYLRDRRRANKATAGDFPPAAAPHPFPGNFK